MIDLTCDCGKKLKVRDDQAGKVGRCPACKNPITVPLDRGLEGRVAALEKENAGLRRALVACMLVAAAGFVFLMVRDAAAHRIQPATPMPASLPKIIEAEGFVVKDWGGNVRATLGRLAGPVTDQEALFGLDLYAGGVRRGLFATVPVPDGGDGDGRARLILTDGRGKQRVIVEGDGNDTGMYILDKTAHMRVGLNVYNSGMSNFHLYGNTHKPRVQFGVNDGGNEPFVFDVFDDNARPHSMLGKDGLPPQREAP
jgi:hypothetical protein